MTNIELLHIRESSLKFYCLQSKEIGQYLQIIYKNLLKLIEVKSCK